MGGGGGGVYFELTHEDRVSEEVIHLQRWCDYAIRSTLDPHLVQDLIYEYSEIQATTKRIGQHLRQRGRGIASRIRKKP